MTSTNTVNLLLQALPLKARLAHHLPGLTNNLLSVAALCDAGCEVFFHWYGCEVTLKGTTIIRGWRDPQNRLWRVKIVDNGWTTNITLRDDAKRPAIALSTPPRAFAPATTHANSLYECSNTNQLINFYYACFNYPTVSSLTKAIDRGYMKGWQGLTSQQVKHHIIVSPKSKMGHMDQTRQGVRSTQDTAGLVDSSILNEDASALMEEGQVTLKNPPPVLTHLHHNGHMEYTPQEPHNARTHFVFCQVHTISGIISSDQTGRFPITSNQGHA